MNWYVDDTIDLTAACEAADWHMATAIENVTAAGLSRRDAEAFVEFCFTDYAHQQGSRDNLRAEDYVSDSQWERLTQA